MRRLSVVGWGVAGALCLGLAFWISRRGGLPEPGPSVRLAASDAAPTPETSLTAAPEPISPAAEPANETPPPGEKPDFLQRLCHLAPEDFKKKHPGALEKLAALLEAHPGDEVWEAGALAFLARELPREARLEFWEKAAEAFPENLAVSDKMVRMALDSAGGRVDALLTRQQARTPQDPSLAWLRASLAFQDARPGDAEAMLLSAAKLPPWKERSGLTEQGGFLVREALGEPVSDLEVVASLDLLSLPSLSLYAKLTREGGALAKDLRARGEPDRARALMESLDQAGASMEAGGRLLITHLVGAGVRKRNAQALAAHATAIGDMALLDQAQRLEARLRQEGEAAWTWSQQELKKKQDQLKEIVARSPLKALAPESELNDLIDLNFWVDPETVHPAVWTRAGSMLLEEDRRRLSQMAGESRGGDLSAYRAWLALQPPTR